MRISTGISQLKKIRDKAREWASAETAYYSTSLSQFKEMQELCDEISGIISGISHVKRCDVAESCEVNANISAMQEQINTLTEQMAMVISRLDEKPTAIESTNSIIVSPISSSTESDDDSAEKPIAKVAIPNGVSDGNSLIVTMSAQKDREQVQKDSRDAAREYNRVLKKLATSKHKYRQVAELSNLLYRWHTKRFYDNRKYCCQFHFSYKRVARLIYLITIAYGHHMANGTLDVFREQFNEYMDRLGVDERTTNQHAVPKEIYDLEKEYDEYFDNVNALVLYEQLCDMGLSELINNRNLIRDYQLSDCGVDSYMIESNGALRGSLQGELDIYHTDITLMLSKIGDEVA